MSEEAEIKDEIKDVKKDIAKAETPADVKLLKSRLEQLENRLSMIEIDWKGMKERTEREAREKEQRRAEHHRREMESANNKIPQKKSVSVFEDGDDDL